MLKSKLLAEIQRELLRHPFGNVSGAVVYPGCIGCGRHITTENAYREHICKDVLPPLLQKLSNGSDTGFKARLLAELCRVFREHEFDNFNDGAGRAKIGCAKCRLESGRKQNLLHWCRDVVPAVLDQLSQTS